MRTIKFRGKKKFGNEWLIGSLMTVGDEFFIFPEEAPHSYNVYRVNAETVGQFTGLLDKNGKEIYEGDIVEFINVDLPDCVIVYDNGSFMYRELGEDISLEELRLQITSKVIGNIYDNPELLKNND